MFVASALINTEDETCKDDGGNKEGSETNPKEEKKHATSIWKGNVKATVMNYEKEPEKWKMGEQYGCPENWLFNGKSRCLKIGNMAKYFEKQTDGGEGALDVCKRYGNEFLAKEGDVEIFQFKEDEDFLIWNYGLLKGKKFHSGIYGFRNSILCHI